MCYVILTIYSAFCRMRGFKMSWDSIRKILRVEFPHRTWVSVELRGDSSAETQ